VHVVGHVAQAFPDVGLRNDPCHRYLVCLLYGPTSAVELTIDLDSGSRLTSEVVVIVDWHDR